MQRQKAKIKMQLYFRKLKNSHFYTIKSTNNENILQKYLHSKQLVLYLQISQSCSSKISSDYQKLQIKYFDLNTSNRLAKVQQNYKTHKILLLVWFSSYLLDTLLLLHYILNVLSNSSNKFQTHCNYQANHHDLV